LSANTDGKVDENFWGY